MDNHELYVKDIQANQLISRADALTSDYSSATVDYMFLDRHIAFMLDVVAEYVSSREFVFDPVQDWITGKALYTTDCGSTWNPQ